MMIGPKARGMLAPILLAALALIAAACSTASSTSGISEAPPDNRPKVTGTLRSGYAGIGGEHTGWMILPMAGTPLEVDVSGIKEQAQRLDGTQVTITGHYIEKRYVERGPSQVLVAESIERARP